MKKVTMEQIENAQTHVNSLKEKWLAEHGWECTYKNPGSIWLWEKVINDKTYSTSRDIAIQIEKAIINEDH